LTLPLSSSLAGVAFLHAPAQVITLSKVPERPRLLLVEPFLLLFRE
jgi:hypothetical protein